MQTFFFVVFDKHFVIIDFLKQATSDQSYIDFPFYLLCLV